MIIGKLPGQNLAADAKADGSIPVSSYYAELFADLAKERGFDGWLLNVEVGLQGGVDQARALAAWVTLLQQEMFKRVGPHSQVIWYDSVTVRGDLWWQDRLNALNLPFFLNSGGIFTNYWVSGVVAFEMRRELTRIAVVQQRSPAPVRLLPQD